MKLIVGLGNPGTEYQQTRHNVGFLVVDELAKNVNESFEKDKYTFSEVASTDDLILAKPQTFMNNSGEAVKYLLEKYMLLENSLVVVHDDLDIPLGQYKIQHAVGPKVHNGISSIEQRINTDQFTRVRVGVDHRDPNNRISGEAYVLQNFTKEERGILSGVIHTIASKLIND